MSDIAIQRVLVVEDESNMRQGLLRAIPAMGYVACEASSAEEALTKMERDPCAVIVLDLRLPRMDGMEFFKAIRKKWPATQVIVLTGFGSLAAAQTAIHLDVVEFLTKPCALKDLEAAISRAFRRSVEQSSAERVLSLLKSDEASEPSNEVTKTMEQVEREHILDTLRRLDGNRSAAAKELGISRRTLHARLKEYKDAGYSEI